MIPLPEFKFIVLNTIYKFVPQFNDNLLQKKYEVDNSFLILANEGAVQLASKVRNMWIIMACLGLVSFVIILRQIVKYFNYRNVFLKYSNEIRNEELMKQFQGIKDSLVIKSKVKYISSRYCKSPVTMGIFEPAVMVPEKIFELSEKQRAFILRHELIHVKHKDLLVKYLGLMVIALHWYNPVCYFLFYELCNMSEITCDNKVVEKLNQNERRDYANLILELVTEKESNHSRFSMGLINNNVVILRRRILEMKMIRKNKIILSCVTMLFTCMISTVTAFAYNPPVTINVGENEFGQNYSFISDSEMEDEGEVIPYEKFFLDESGNIYNMTKPEIDKIVICDHKTTTSGTVQEHNKKNNGGCEIIYRTGWRCLFCGYIKVGNIIKTVTYPNCSH